jgi:hypothetical protein
VEADLGQSWMAIATPVGFAPTDYCERGCHIGLSRPASGVLMFANPKTNVSYLDRNRITGLHGIWRP